MNTAVFQYRNLFSTVILILTSFLFACDSDKVKHQKVDPAFTEYISAFTNGVVSNNANIMVRLEKEYADVNYTMPISKTLFEFHPEVEGEAWWLDSRTVEFRPSQELKSGEEYTGKFFLSELMEVDNKLKTLGFNFSTLKQAVYVYFDGMHAYSVSNLALQQASGKIVTADVADQETIERVVSAKQNGKELPIQWVHQDDGISHYFKVDSIKRGEVKSEVRILWDGNLLDLDDASGEEIYEVPPLGDFKVVKVEVTNQPKQYVSIQFSDPIDVEQTVDGLIRFENGGDVTYQIDDNEVKVFPTARLSGPYQLLIDQGVRNVMNYQLADSAVHLVVFTNIKPQIELIGEGVIVPSSATMKFPFKAVNLKAVTVNVIRVYESNVGHFLQVNQMNGDRELTRVGRLVYKGEVPLIGEGKIDLGSWNTYSLDLADLVKTEPGAIYRIELSFDIEHSLYPCSGDDEGGEKSKLVAAPRVIEEDLDAGYDTPSDHRDYYYDEYYYDDYDYDDYHWKDRDNPCKPSYYSQDNQKKSKNVLISDLGIIAKGGNGKEISFAVTDIQSTNPLSGVKLEVYNYQNQLMNSGFTDIDGLATIKMKKKPFLLVAKRGSQRGYLRLDDGSALSMSMFDISGSANKKGIKGFIYGERGVWRPGDSLFLSFILEDKLEVLPDNHPVVFEFFNPAGQIVQRKVSKKGVDGFYDFRTSTAYDAPTGNWTAKVKVGGNTYSKNIKVEAIKPNRLKIKLDFGKKYLTADATNEGKLNVKWLHGAKAGNLKTDIEMSVQQTRTSFKGFEGFQFDDEMGRFSPTERKIFDQEIDDEGNALVTPDLAMGGDIPGSMQATFRMRAFEKSGEFSTSSFSMPISSYDSYVGLKLPEGRGWTGALDSEMEHLVTIGAVSRDGEPVDKKVNVELYRVEWRWWWDNRYDRNLSRYVTSHAASKVYTKTVETKNGRASFDLGLKSRYYGRMLMIVEDQETGHRAAKLFWMDYYGWWNDPNVENASGAEMLTFSLDKRKYDVGEKVTVNVPSSGQGRILMSIESGSEVISQQWIAAQDKTTEMSFICTAEMSPNAYVNLSYIQPHAQTLNDLPIRMYGVQPLFVEDPETHLNPILEMPGELEPEMEVSLSVSEKNGKSMTYTIAIVDEGLLDLTRFQTPAPWRYFYAREALGIRTWDMYKMVAGAFTGEMAGLLALGGGDEVNPDAKKNANRFKPVVTYLGPFKLSSGAKNNHNFKMPNYVGSVRAMIVAGNQKAYGQTEKTVPVRKPLMVLATLPRVLGPSETVKLPVTLFAMDEKIKDVKVTVKTNALLKIEGEKTQTVHFDEMGDEVIDFDLSVAGKLGIARVEIIAEGHGQKARYEIELDVRIPNPPITKVNGGLIEASHSWTGSYNAIGVEGTNKATLELSSIPPLNLEDRLGYLIRYPHGCVEQTTSSAFPQLYLNNLMDVDAEWRSEIDANIRAAIKRLSTFQRYDGSLSYWPGQSYHNEWGTNYAGHFLIEAKNKGYQLPIGFLDRWVKFQKSMANNWNRGYCNGNRYQRSDIVQAYRLYTLALAKKPALGAMNRLKEKTNVSVAAKWRLAAAYVLIGKKEVAWSIVEGLEDRVASYNEMGHSYGSGIRDNAMILETLVLLDDKDRGRKLLQHIADRLSNQRWMSTQSTSYALMAVSKFVGSGDAKSPMSYKLKLNGKDQGPITVHQPMVKYELDIVNGQIGTVEVENTAGKLMFAKLIMKGTPLMDSTETANNNVELVISYKDMLGNPMDVTSIPQGTDFIAEVSIHHPGTLEDYDEMVLSQIFASGWEIRNFRMDEAVSLKQGNLPEYQDIRDDRVYSYFDIQRSQKHFYRVLLNASYAGKYYMPTVYCEAMYDDEVNAAIKGYWVEVLSNR